MLLFFIACSDPAPIKGKDSFSGDDSGAVSVDTAGTDTADVLDTALAFVVPEDSDTSDESLPPCPPVTYPVRTASGETVYVPTLLLLARDSASPSGTIPSGLNALLVVDATGYCADVVLAHMSFSLHSEEAGPVDWLDRVSDVPATVSYVLDGQSVSVPLDVPDDTSGTPIWTVVFPVPLRIDRDETVPFSFNVEMGGVRTNGRRFFARMESAVGWYGVTNSAEYPYPALMGAIDGNSLLLGE